MKVAAKAAGGRRKAAQIVENAYLQYMAGTTKEQRKEVLDLERVSEHTRLNSIRKMPMYLID